MGMSYNERKEELVTRLGMFTLQQYKHVYNVIGGHAGSYVRLWYIITSYELSIEKALKELMSKTEMHLILCLVQSGNKTEHLQVLHELKSKAIDIIS